MQNNKQFSEVNYLKKEIFIFNMFLLNSLTYFIFRQIAFISYHFDYCFLY